eukprot:scaffold7465_cov390-Prasinococcus_capsulatus_cf.AAC.2
MLAEQRGLVDLVVRHEDAPHLAPAAKDGRADARRGRRRAQPQPSGVASERTEATLGAPARSGSPQRFGHKRMYLHAVCKPLLASLLKQLWGIPLPSVTAPVPADDLVVVSTGKADAWIVLREV